MCPPNCEPCDEFEIENLSNDDLEKEISFALAFGPEIDPNANQWIISLLQEQERRGL